MRRKATLTMMAAGGILSLLLGSGLISMVSDSVASTGNVIESDRFSASSHDLKIFPGPCANATSSAQFSDGPLTAAFDNTSGPYDLTTSPLVAGPNACLKNFGSGTGRVTVVFANVVQTEVGVCLASESQAGDTSCANGALGEIGDIVRVRLANANGSSSASCVGQSGLISTAGAMTLDADLAPGETCDYRLDYLAIEDDTGRSKAQTDRVQWDIVFTLQDA